MKMLANDVATYEQAGYSKTQRGTGFIEVLVALVILAVGLLGVLSMQVRGLKSNQQAVFATDVSLLAEDMADRILAYGTLSSVGNLYNGVDSTAARCVGVCNVVQTDTNGWIDAFAQSNLPSAQGNVVWTGSIYTITIRWDQDRRGLVAGDIDDDCADNDPSATLSCFRLEVQP
ncbi:MAG: type IV pilus assembly protein PilV [Candidatus Endobugula sp.]|jgi:type IV pilus assembly protein PilV